MESNHCNPPRVPIIFCKVNLCVVEDQNMLGNVFSYLIRILKPELLIFVGNFWFSDHFCKAKPRVFQFSFYKKIEFIKEKLENLSVFLTKMVRKSKIPNENHNSGFKTRIKCERNVSQHSLIFYNTQINLTKNYIHPGLQWPMLL